METIRGRRQRKAVMVQRDLCVSLSPLDENARILLVLYVVRSPHRYLRRSSPHDQRLDSLTEHSTVGCHCGHGIALKEAITQERIRASGQMHRDNTASGDGAKCVLQSMCWQNIEKLGETGNPSGKDYL